MAFRFSRRIKIAPGIRINVSKSGVSTTLGGRGANVNVGKRGVRGTVTIPGTGISYSEKISGRTKNVAGPAPQGSISAISKAVVIFAVLILLAALIY